MKYTVLSVDDSRKELRDAIHEEMQALGIERLDGVSCVDGRKPGAIDKWLLENPIRVTGERFHNGELGIWASVYNAWDRFIVSTKAKKLIVFEDDAVVKDAFGKMLPFVEKELQGTDWDFFAWAVPHDQKVDYYYNRAIYPNGTWSVVSPMRHKYEQSPHYVGKTLICKAYQGYHAVCIMYSRRGVFKLMDMLMQDGITEPLDLFLFRHSLAGNLNGYTLLPDVTTAVTFKEKGTIARNSGMYN